jgi:hypothetical protein
MNRSNSYISVNNNIQSTTTGSTSDFFIQQRKKIENKIKFNKSEKTSINTIEINDKFTYTKSFKIICSKILSDSNQSNKKAKTLEVKNDLIKNIFSNTGTMNINKQSPIVNEKLASTTIRMSKSPNSSNNNLKNELKLKLNRSISIDDYLIVKNKWKENKKCIKKNTNNCNNIKNKISN